jgi:uncharacterized protein (UPF0147 family)
MKDIESALQSASTGGEKELKALVHHTSARVILRMLFNPNFTEDLALVIANRKNVGAEVLEELYIDKKWRESYRIRLALCKNPKTPQKISLASLKSLRIFDQADLTSNRQVPINVRTAAETHISEKILSMPLGIKVALARRASINILMKLLEDGMREVVPVCLESPYMNEGILCKVISMKKIGSQVVRQIADHPKWSRRHDVQWALIRSRNAPLARVIDFFRFLKITELRELYDDPAVPTSTRPFIYREIMDREGT